MGKLLEIVRQTSQKEEAQPLGEEKRAVLEEISVILDKLGVVESALSFETDEDLIDADIYEIKSLNCRYSYYIKQAKKLGISGISR